MGDRIEIQEPVGVTSAPIRGNRRTGMLTGPSGKPKNAIGGHGHRELLAIQILQNNVSELGHSAEFVSLKVLWFSPIYSDCWFGLMFMMPKEAAEPMSHGVGHCNACATATTCPI